MVCIPHASSTRAVRRARNAMSVACITLALGCASLPGSSRRAMSVPQCRLGPGERWYRPLDWRPWRWEWNLGWAEFDIPYAGRIRVPVPARPIGRMSLRGRLIRDAGGTERCLVDEPGTARAAGSKEGWGEVDMRDCRGWGEKGTVGRGMAPAKGIDSGSGTRE